MSQSVRRALCLLALAAVPSVVVMAVALPSRAAPAPTAPAPTAAVATPAADTTAAQPKFPEPSLYPIEWELKFDHKTPRRIVVDDPRSGRRNAYWYMTYSVTNPTDKPVEFTPSFQLLSQNSKSFDPVRSDLAIPPAVFQTIFNREGNKFLESHHKIQGTLNPGEEQSRDGVAIWPEPQTRMGKFDVFVGGLSGEYTILKKKDGKFTQIDLKKAAEELKGVPEADRLTLRKTLQLTFQVPGDEVRPGEDPVIKKGQKWVMR
jgi:hypothetical protein